MNQAAAKYQTRQLQDAEAQLEIYSLLSEKGPIFVHRIAAETGREKAEVRWHLREMQKRGEVRFRAGWGYGV